MGRKNLTFWLKFSHRNVIFCVLFNKAWVWSKFYLKKPDFEYIFFSKSQRKISKWKFYKLGEIESGIFCLVGFWRNFLQRVRFRIKCFLGLVRFWTKIFSIFSFVEFNYSSTACTSHNVFLFTKLYTYCLQRLCQLNYSNRRTKKFLHSFWRGLCLLTSIWLHTFFSIWTSYMQKLSVTIRMTDSRTWIVSVSQMSD